MLRNTATLLDLIDQNRIGFSNKGIQVTVFKSALEAYLIHLRNLYLFFYRFRFRVLRDTDIHVSQFLNDSRAYSRERFPQKSITRQHIYKIDRALAHLTYSRNYYHTGWDTRRLTNNLERTINAFKQGLPSQRRSWFSGL